MNIAITEINFICVFTSKNCCSFCSEPSQQKTQTGCLSDRKCPSIKVGEVEVCTESNRETRVSQELSVQNLSVMQWC